MQTTVLLMTTDPSVPTEVAKALKSNGHVMAPAVARDPRDLTVTLSRETVPVVLVDLGADPRQMLSEVSRITDRFPATRFVALSASVNDALLLEAMEAGVRRVVARQGIAQELQGVLNRLAISGAADAAARGEIITILSAGGGCGATTIAANLANELGAQREGEPSLLVDLDLSYGTLALYFGLEPHYAVDHVLGYERQLDAELIRSTSSAVNPRVHLMASTASTSFSHPASVDLARVGQFLKHARHAYRYTIVDAPRVSMDVAASLADLSTQVLLVFQLTVKNVRIARVMIDALDERGVMRGLVPVANRMARGSAISAADASQALRDLPVQTLRNDYAAAIEGFNYGKPLAEVAPRSAFRRDLLGLIKSFESARREPAS